MKNKIIIGLSCFLVVVAAVVIFLIVRKPADKLPDKTSETTETALEVPTEKLSNIKKLPANMTGFCLNTSTDLEKIDETSFLSRVNAIKPNTCVIYFNSEIELNDNENKSDEKLSSIIKVLREKSSDCLALFDDSDENLIEIAKFFNLDGIILRVNGTTDFDSSERIKENVENSEMSFSVLVDGEPDNNTVDFIQKNEVKNVFLDLDTSKIKSVNSTLDDWSSFAMMHNTNIYSLFRNDSLDEKNPLEKYDEVKYLYDKTCLGGGVMFDYESLDTNKFKITENLNNYYEDFNDTEFTTLEFTDFSLDKDKITLKGKCDKSYPIFYRCNSDSYMSVNSDSKGIFSFQMQLENGQNNLIVRHRNTFKQYSIFVNSPDGKSAVNTETDTNAQGKPTPYTDNGLGTQIMCIIQTDNAKTVNAKVDGENSDPTFTPIKSGAVDTVTGFDCSSTNIMYILSSGMKILADDATLIVDGYKMPNGQVQVKSENGALKFSGDTDVPTRFVLTPQEYFVGNPGGKFNVEKFTAEYLDIEFFNTEKIEVSIDLADNEIFSAATVLSGDDSCTLRLKLKNSGKFRGYSYEKSDDGFRLSFTRIISSLDGAKIVLDPGHGGYGSPGTTYMEKTYERETTLAICLKLKNILESQGADVILTRDSDDKSVFLSERVELTRREKPDVFVSVHCDGNDDKSLFGVHSFYYKSFSFPLAKKIQNELVGVYTSGVHSGEKEISQVDLGVKFYPYNVTRVENCPSVLIETGLLTNGADASVLSSDDGREKIAEAIGRGIENYLEQS